MLVWDVVRKPIGVLTKGVHPLDIRRIHLTSELRDLVRTHIRDAGVATISSLVPENPHVPVFNIKGMGSSVVTEWGTRSGEDLAAYAIESKPSVIQSGFRLVDVHGSGPPSVPVVTMPASLIDAIKRRLPPPRQHLFTAFENAHDMHKFCEDLTMVYPNATRSGSAHGNVGVQIFSGRRVEYKDSQRLGSKRKRGEFNPFMRCVICFVSFCCMTEYFNIIMR